MKTINTDTLTRLVAEHTNEELKDCKVGGKEVIVHQDGKCVFHAVYGHSSVGEKLLRENMMYRAASMTKPVTAAAVLTLVDRGLLDLSAPVSDFYPQAKNMSVAKIENNSVAGYASAKNIIRVRNLLNHTSGIGCGPLCGIVNQDFPGIPLKEAVTEILAQPLCFEPDTMQSYSATNAFDVAAGIVEIVSGMDYGEYLKKYIFAPVGMTDTTFSPSDEQWKNMVTMFDRTSDGIGVNAKVYDGCVFETYIPERMAAGAGLAVTARDYIRFADMLCMGGKSVDGQTVLSEKAVETMSTQCVPESIVMGTERWGLGVRVITSDAYPNGLGTGCFGWSGAYGTHFWVDPENKMTVVMMKNSRYDGGAGNNSANQLERDVYASLE